MILFVRLFLNIFLIIDIIFAYDLLLVYVMLISRSFFFCRDKIFSYLLKGSFFFVMKYVVFYFYRRFFSISFFLFFLFFRKIFGDRRLWYRVFFGSYGSYSFEMVIVWFMDLNCFFFIGIRVRNKLWFFCNFWCLKVNVVGYGVVFFRKY